MFRLSARGSPVANGVEISCAGDPQIIFAACVYISPSKTWSFSGLEVSENDLSEVADTMLAQRLYIVTLVITTEVWSDIQRWIGWADERGALMVFHKDITEQQFTRSHLGDFLNFDIESVVSVRGTKALRLNSTIAECTTVHQISELLSPETTSELLG